jgi:hypothetical protein
MNKSRFQTSIEEFGQKIFKILKTDRDVVIAVSGFTGEGKSTFMHKLAKAYAKVAGVNYQFDKSMTWSRKELTMWIDGLGEQKTGQKPEYSVVVADELISMFYNRNFTNTDQKSAIELLNKCRDRHLLIMGAVPVFFQLDVAFRSRVRFFVYIIMRGVALVFQQERNPFSRDPWSVSQNYHLFERRISLSKSPNFLGVIHYDDFDEQEKEDYYKLRNEKRLNTESSSQGKSNNSTLSQYVEKSAKDELIKMIIEHSEIKGNKLTIDFDKLKELSFC